MNGWMNEWMNEWISEWVNEWMNEKNEWMNECAPYTGSPALSRAQSCNLMVNSPSTTETFIHLYLGEDWNIPTSYNFNSILANLYISNFTYFFVYLSIWCHWQLIRIGLANGLEQVEMYHN